MNQQCLSIFSFLVIFNHFFGCPDAGFAFAICIKNWDRLHCTSIIHQQFGVDLSYFQCLRAPIKHNSSKSMAHASVIPGKEGGWKEGRNCGAREDLAQKGWREIMDGRGWRPSQPGRKQVSQMMRRGGRKWGCKDKRTKTMSDPDSDVLFITALIQ